MSLLELRPFPNVGAEIFDCDLAQLTVGDADQLEAAFAAFGLLVFRNQSLTQDELQQFASRWGTAIPADLGDPQSVGDEPGVWSGGDSYAAEPDLGMVVYLSARADVIPDRLSFSSLAAAFDALASPTSRALEGLTATHRSANGSEAAHPLVIRHPISNRSTLYINPAYVMSVEGMEDDAALRLLNELCDHCVADEFVQDVDWEPGTVVLWDNRALWHFDRSTRSTSAGLSRIRIAGGQLAPAVRPDKSDPSLSQRAAATLAGGIITAAMTGIAEVLEPERLRQDIEIVSEAPDREPLDGGLDFGGLPPLD